jgi:phosphoribosylformylglycinamidine cyclo-ligase
MNLDDVICLGKPEGLVVANLLNRNANLVGDEVVAEIISSYIELQKTLASYGVDFTLGGGETADCGDVTRTLAVDAVIAGRIAHSKLLSTDNIKPGQVIVGLSGAGKASWENVENSGIGSNGLTLARHTLLKKEYCEKYPEVVDPNTDSSVVYNGPFAVDDNPNGLGMTVGEALLSPTRTFAPVLVKIFESEFDKISACIHVSGGALSKVIRFGKGNIYVKDQLLPIPAIFNLIQETGNIPWKEMYQVFSMGQRMEVYCEQSAADSIIKTSKSMGVEAGIIGRVEKNPDSDSQNIVKVDSPNGSFEYQL